MRMPRSLRALARFAGRCHVAGIRRWGWLRSARTLVLTTVGRRSGKLTSTPLHFVADGDRLYVAASFFGLDEAPGWYRNLEANPMVEVERGGGERRHRARALPREEAVRIWPRLRARSAAYAAAQKRTTRVISIVELTPSD